MGPWQVTLQDSVVYRAALPAVPVPSPRPDVTVSGLEYGGTPPGMPLSPRTPFLPTGHPYCQVAFSRHVFTRSGLPLRWHTRIAVSTEAEFRSLVGLAVCVSVWPSPCVLCGMRPDCCPRNRASLLTCEPLLWGFYAQNAAPTSPTSDSFP